MAKEFEWRHDALAATLDRNPTTLKERSIGVFVLGFAVEKFEKKIEVWRDLQIRLTQNSEIANVKNRVRPYVLRPKAVVVEDLTEEKGTRGAGTPGYVLSEDYYLVHAWLRIDFISRSAPVDFFLRGEELSRLQLM